MASKKKNDAEIPPAAGAEQPADEKTVGPKHRKRTEKIDRCVAVKINETERADYLTTLLRLLREADALSDEAKAVAKDFKTRIDGKKNEIDRLNPILTTGIEHRTIACTRVYDYEALRVYTVRPDTGERIDDREMTVAETQQMSAVIIPPTEAKPEDVKLPVLSIVAKEAPPDTRLIRCGDRAMLAAVVGLIYDTKRAAVATIQRRLNLSYNYTMRYVEDLERIKILGPANGDNPREILVEQDLALKMLEAAFTADDGKALVEQKGL